LVLALGFGVAAIGAPAAFADDHGGRYDDRDRYDDRRPDRCDIDHDHRGHEARYYDYYPADRYYRSGPYRGGASVTIDVGRGGRYYDDYYGGRGRYDDRYDRRGSRVIDRRTFDTRYRARIVLVEEIFYGRGRDRLVCTVSARGPDARYVPYGQLRSIAARHCSRRAEIRIH
jgi:hypothetical protein